MRNPYISSELFLFLKDLKANNTRDWFNENKKRYIEVLRDPLLSMIEDFGPLLHSISPYFDANAKTSGGSLFRIYRDVRFSANKDPYKTHAGIHFRHAAGKDAHAPGYYLHLEPGNVFIALGIWRPEMAVLSRIRNSIVSDPETWISITTDPSFSDTYDLEGDSLLRAPKGFDPDHPLIVDLRRKDFAGVCRLEQNDAEKVDFLEILADTWRKADRFMRYLTETTGHPF